ncbi:MAG: transposase [Cyclobacteriaceae bacterium]
MGCLNAYTYHFISDSVWSYILVYDLVAKKFYKLVEGLGGLANLCLVIDESGNPKKGKGSAGVERQYCGKVGKTDNCPCCRWSKFFSVVAGGQSRNP